MKNEDGLTLIELLTAITILSIIGLIVWQAFLQGIGFSERVMTDNQLNQEATIVISTLKDIHQNAVDPYEVISNECKITINSNIVFEHPNICYELMDEYNTKINGEIDTSLEHSKRFVLTVSDKNKSNQSITIQGQLYRLKEQ